MLALLASAAFGQSAELGPQGIVREYCKRDAMGARTSAARWQAMAPLVAWPLEPAWDQVLLITGYSVASPVVIAPGVFGVDVRYDIVARITPLEVDTSTFAEVVRFEVASPEQRGWLILGPPHPPHLFASGVNMQSLRRALERGGAGYLPSSTLVRELFASAGWSLREQTAELLADSTAVGPVDEPRPGDLIAYTWNGAPYHIGVLDSLGAVISSTLNLGVVRTTVNAFPGEAKFLRIRQPPAS